MYQALNATSQTLRQFLRTRIEGDPFLFAPAAPYRARGMVVSLQTPIEMREAGREGVSVWLYRVLRDDLRANDPPRRISLTEMKPAPLPMRLHYLVTPITSREALGDPDTEQYLLGKVLQVLHAQPILRGAELAGELAGTSVELHVRLEALALEEITRVWDALDGSYQLSVSYEVSVVELDSAREPDGFEPVQQLHTELAQIVAGVSP